MIQALHHGRSFFVGSVNFGRDLESVPVNHLGHFGLVDDVHGHRLAFGHAKQRTGRLPVVRQRPDESTGRDLEIDFTDA
jgi:hypothetical protein